jgi:hypothetical protein
MFCSCAAAQDDSLYLSPLTTNTIDIGNCGISAPHTTIIYLSYFDSTSTVLVVGKTYSDTVTGPELNNLVNWAHKHWCYKCGCAKIQHKLWPMVKGVGWLCPKHENWWDNEKSK